MRLGLSPWLAVPIVAVAYGALHIQTNVAKTLGSVAFGGAAGFLFIDTGSLFSTLKLGLLVRGLTFKVRFLPAEPLLEDLGEIDLQGIHWVIVGGESGHGARPMNEEWALSLLNQCKEAAVPFFSKQWGGVRTGLAGRVLRGQLYDEYPPPYVRISRIAFPEIIVFSC
jgi:hypothetical protein